jgi:methionyl-tRNA formyltransferase
MRMIFMGTPEAAVPTLKRCVKDGHEILSVWTQPDRPAGRGNKLKASPVKEFALERGLVVEQPTKIKTSETFELFASYKPDLAVVVAYGRILPASFLKFPRLGCINVHFSLLPKYRGAAPVNWAIVKGENLTGITTMQMDEGLDTGPILMQRSVEIVDEETAPQLMDKLSIVGAELLSETLAKLDALKPTPQNHEEATLAPIIQKEDGLIDWSNDAFAIDRCVRGFQPWPTAYTHFGSERLVIWQAIPSQSETSQVENIESSPGQIIEARGDNLVVRCGAGGTSLRLIEVQLEGRKRMSVRDFINGIRPQVGIKLG